VNRCHRPKLREKLPSAHLKKTGANPYIKLLGSDFQVFTMIFRRLGVARFIVGD
jgi:hypothetical protein